MDSDNNKEKIVAQHPLSDDQQAIWVLTQLNPLASKAYTEIVFLKLSGELPIARLQKTIRLLGDMHQALRVSVSRDGKYFSVHDSHLYMQLDHYSRDNLKTADWIQQQLQIQFDLTKEKLCKITLFQMGTKEALLSIVTHHLIVDGYSTNVLIRDFEKIYNALCIDETYCPEWSMQFHELNLLQKQITDSLYQESHAYWTQQLASPIPMSDFPADKTRPSMKSFQGAQHHFAINNTLHSQLKLYATKNKATLFMVLLSAFKTLLFRYGHQKDIIVGVPSIKRTSPESYSAISHATSIFPVRTRLDDTMTFHELLLQVRRTLLMSLENKFINLNALYKALDFEWNISRGMSIVDVVFNLDTVNANPQCRGLDCAIMSPYLSRSQGEVEELIKTKTAKFDLFLNIVDDSEKLHAALEYSTDLFTDHAISLFSKGYLELLEQITREEQLPLYQLSIIPDAVKTNILDTWNQTTTQYPKDQRLEALFLKSVSNYKNNIALQSEHTSLTYQALNEQANALAQRLRIANLKPRTGVMLMFDKCIEYIVSLLAVLKAGGVYIPIDPQTPIKRLTYILNDLHEPMILSRPNLLQHRPSAYTVFDSDAAGITILTNVTQKSPLMFSNEVLYILYTSGSTGHPKGVLVTHEGVSRVILNTNFIQIQPTDKISLLCDLSFDISMFEIWGALLTGACCVLLTKEDLLNFQQLQRKLTQYKVNIGTLTPALFHTIVQTNPTILSNYEVLIVVGDILDPHRSQTFLQACGHVRLINGYGPTEASIFATAYCVNDATMALTTIPIGKPISNTSVYILDSHLQPLPIGVIGELYIGGPGVALGYLNNPSLTAEKFIKNPFSNSNVEMLYRTGDLVRYLHDGNIEFIGRIGTQVKIRGYRVELGEIDFFLKQHPLVEEAATLLHTNDNQDQSLIAYIKLHTNVHASTLNIFDIQKRAHEQIKQWASTWDMAYQSPLAKQKSYLLNSVGWKNSYDGADFSDEIMREWVECTVQQIMRLKPKRILEIGCGTGLLLFKLAPECDAYVGIDPVDSTIENLQKIKNELGLEHVQLMVGSADTLESIDASNFDVVVLNSVIQYFPGADYLERVLESALKKCTIDGKIFIGDVRALMYEYTFATDRAIFHASDRDLIQTIQRKINDIVVHENELFVDPDFFLNYIKTRVHVDCVELSLKKLKHVTEMSRFRYDLILYLQSKTLNKAVVSRVFDWRKEVQSIDKISNVFAEKLPIFSINNIPNQRVIDAISTEHALQHTSPTLLFGEFKKRNPASPQQGIDPWDLWALEATSDYRVHLQVDRSSPAVLEAIFTAKALGRPILPLAIQSSHRSALTNHPLLSTLAREIREDIRTHLIKHLPQYMRPSDIMILGKLPLTNSGKINRKVLSYQPKYISEYHAPTNPTEMLLIQTLQQIVNIDIIGIQDGFFDLGLDSIRVIRWVVLLHQQGIELHPQQIFIYPTIQKLAEHIQNQSKKAGVSESKSLRKYNALNTESTSYSAPLIDKAMYSTILITGGTGYFGLYLLKELLIQTNAKIYCLIRPRHASTTLLQCITEHFEWTFPNEKIEPYLPRLALIEGDITQQHFGLPFSLWDELSETVEAVYHAAANVRHIGDKAQFIMHNAEGTQQVIHFCQQGKVKYLHHISTVAVMGVLRDEENCCSFSENDLDIQQYFIYPYAESKFLAEKMLQHYIKEGGKVNIYRIGTIGADTKGRFQKNIHENYFTRLLHATLTLGVAPRVDYHQDYLPVCELAHATIALSQHTIGETYHLYNTQTMSYFEMCLLLQSMGYPLQWMDEAEYHLYITRLTDNPLLQDAIGCMLDFLTGIDLRFAQLHVDKTYQTLNHFKINLKKEYTQNLKTLILHGMAMGFFPKPTGAEISTGEVNIV